MTATYWEIGRRIVEFEQGGEKRAESGKELLRRLSSDLTKRFGRGFAPVNLSQLKRFYLIWSPQEIFQTLSEKSGGSPEPVKFPLPCTILAIDAISPVRHFRDGVSGIP
jgi:hypothetical protein